MEQFKAEDLVKDISLQTAKLVQNVIIDGNEDIIPVSKYRIHDSLKGYIQHLWQKRYQEQQEGRRETDSVPRPNLSFDASNDKSNHIKELNAGLSDDEHISLKVFPPKASENPITKKTRSLDLLNSKLSQMLLQQLKAKKDKKPIADESHGELGDLEDKDDLQIEYDSDKPDDHDDHCSDEDNDSEEVDNEEGDTSEGEVIVREKPLVATRIIDSDTERDKDAEPMPDEALLLDLLSGQFVPKSKFVDVEADEEDAFGQLVSGYDNEEEKEAAERQWIKEANEILAQGKENLAIPNDEDAELVRGLYQQQHMEQDIQETKEILEQLDHRRKDREHEKQLRAIRRKRQVILKEDKAQTVCDLIPTGDNEDEDVEDHSFVLSSRENSEFKKWRSEHLSTSSILGSNESSRTLSVSINTTLEAKKTLTLSNTKMKSLFLAPNNSKQLELLKELSFEKEKQATTFKRLS